jgi:membrane-associated phospholipid phosphatase
VGKLANTYLWPFPLLWGLIALIGVIDAVWILATPLQFDASGLGLMIGPAAGLLIGAMGGHRVLPEKLRHFAMGTAFVLLSWPVLRIFNHLVMTLPFPLTDAWLAHGDSDLGLNWHAYLFWVDAHPWIADAMSFTYKSLTIFSCLAFILLVVFGNGRAAHDFLVLFVTSAVIASAVGCLFPAETAMAYYAPVEHMLKHVSPDYGAVFGPYLQEIRTNPHHIFHVAALPGLTAFPSFHTAMGLIVIYCARSRGWFFAAAIAFNGLMIAATPVFGGHYFVDVIAGAALAAALILCLRLAQGENMFPRFRKAALSAEDARPAAAA